MERIPISCHHRKDGYSWSQEILEQITALTTPTFQCLTQTKFISCSYSISSWLFLARPHSMFQEPKFPPSCGSVLIQVAQNCLSFCFFQISAFYFIFLIEVSLIYWFQAYNIVVDRHLYYQAEFFLLSCRWRGRLKDLMWEVFMGQVWKWLLSSFSSISQYMTPPNGKGGYNIWKKKKWVR